MSTSPHLQLLTREMMLRKELVGDQSILASPDISAPDIL